MASGSNNQIYTYQDPRDTSYSCIFRKTLIPIVTIVALATEILVLLILLFFHAILYLITRFNPDFKKVEGMPSNSMELQLAFVRQLENDTEGSIEPKHLARCVYGFDKERNMLRFYQVDNAPVRRLL